MTTLTDERRKLGAEMNDLWNSITSRAIDHALAVYDRGYADGQADLLTRISGEITHPAAASGLPREISATEVGHLPDGAVFESVSRYRVVDGAWAWVEPNIYARYRVISLPDPEPDPDQPLLDALAASGLTEAQARDALDAITAEHAIEPKPVES